MDIHTPAYWEFTAGALKIAGGGGRGEGGGVACVERSPWAVTAATKETNIGFSTHPSPHRIKISHQSNIMIITVGKTSLIQLILHGISELFFWFELSGGSRNLECFPFKQKFGKFWSEFKWIGPLQFVLTGIFRSTSG